MFTTRVNCKWLPMSFLLFHEASPILKVELVVKNPSNDAGDLRDVSCGQEDPLENATHSSILAWRIPWTDEPGRLQSMGSQESDTTEAT